MNINDELKFGTNHTRHMISNDLNPQYQVGVVCPERARNSSQMQCNCCDGGSKSCQASPELDTKNFSSQVRHYRQLPTLSLIRDVANPVEFVLRERLIDAETTIKYLK